MSSYFSKIFLITLFISLSSCGVDWKDAIKKGSIENKSFVEEISFEEKLGLIIVPVSIKGNTYRFLFDTAAPLCISNELQNEFNFEVITTGDIRDSQKSKTKVEYVAVDSLLIGKVSFIKQTAFVSDFKANPIIACLNIDGIIGSNLMRLCNWTIDYQSHTLVMSDTRIDTSVAESIIIPFTPDKQYTMKIDLEIGGKKVTNLKVDYGSNGAISLPEKAYKNLLKNGQMSENMHSIGYAQSGLFGKKKKIEAEFCYSSILKNGLKIDTMLIRKGKGGLIGYKLLSKYIVTIDWDKHNILLTPHSKLDFDFDSYGFNIGNENENIIVQSVVTSSNAYNYGLRPDMKIMALDTIAMNSTDDYCTNIDYFRALGDSLNLTYMDEKDSLKKIFLERQSFISNFNY
jgi:hypothetical protein